MTRQEIRILIELLLKAGKDIEFHPDYLTVSDKDGFSIKIDISDLNFSSIEETLECADTDIVYVHKDTAQLHDFMIFAKILKTLPDGRLVVHKSYPHLDLGVSVMKAALFQKYYKIMSQESEG